ncbi:large conductance mechanosensitive channel protein MscL [Ilumatobacter sp.]|uniref:large conductance mechanosensitive channel protein MscL n=1 Tax=Ilumatobacter sp. TaxID=1967498 RepID=UPI003C387E9F
MLQEFKDFINRGNLVELAVAFILAAFFAPIVTAIVDGVIMNIIAAIFGQPSFDSITIDVGDATLFVGTVITAIVNFVIVAFVCFLIVKAYNSMKEPEDEAGPSETDLLIEIRNELRARND